jgi:hypothetical protein
MEAFIKIKGKAGNDDQQDKKYSFHTEGEKWAIVSNKTWNKAVQ